MEKYSIIYVFLTNKLNRRFPFCHGGTPKSSKESKMTMTLLLKPMVTLGFSILDKNPPIEFDYFRRSHRRVTQLELVTVSSYFLV